MQVKAKKVKNDISLTLNGLTEGKVLAIVNALANHQTPVARDVYTMLIRDPVIKAIVDH